MIGSTKMDPYPTLRETATVSGLISSLVSSLFLQSGTTCCSAQLASWFLQNSSIDTEWSEHPD